MRQLKSSLSSVWVRRLLVLAVWLYFGLGGTLLALRYAVLPHIDDWRPQIAAQFSRALGADVELGAIQVRWQGWNPEFDLRNVHVRDTAGRDLLNMPVVQARLNWKALLPGEQGGLRLQVQGMDLGVGRQPDGHFSLLGQTLTRTDEPAADAPAWFRWLLSQPLIAFQDATLRWHDRLRGAPELTLNRVHAVLVRDPLGGLSLSMAARAPGAGDARLDLRARLQDAVALRQGRLPTDGRAWLQISRIQARDWAPWLDIPDALHQGALDAQVWLDAGQGQPQLTVLAQLDALRWSNGPQSSVQVPLAQAWVQGPWAEWRHGWLGEPMPQGLAFELRTQGVQLQQPQWFDAPLNFGHVSAKGRLLDPGAWAVELDDLNWRSPDITLQGQGRWQAGGLAGRADLQGTIERASLNAIHRYLPLAVNEDARVWMATGLPSGELFNARWRLQGDLAEFPFGEQPQAGDFRVWGDFRNTVINFVPGVKPQDTWPLLQGMVGTADLHRADLQLTASQATMQPTPGQIIALSGLRARIPNLENQATLQVSGQTAAPGSAYMALIQHSPLGGMLDGVFDEARASGQWQMPLSLNIPLLHSEDTRVQGRIDLHQGRLQFLPQAPAFHAIEGSLHFNEFGVRIVQPLKAQLLGGGVQVSGALGGPGDAGLRFRGRFTAGALGDFVGVPGMQRITGTLDYEARLAQQGSAYVFTLDSDTTGLDLDFPAPLSKPAKQPRTLQVQWSDADPQAETLDIRFGDALRLALRHPRHGKNGPYFQAASIGLARAAIAGQGPGMWIDIAYPLFDLDRWNRIVDEFSIPRRGQESPPGSASPPIWPDLAVLSVQADQLRLLGTRLDHAILRAQHGDQGQWSMNLRSEQTTGTLKWQELDGRVQGRVSGRFARLSLGDDPQDTRSLLPQPDIDEKAAFNDDLEMPGIVLQADELRLYGHAVGALSLEGTYKRADHVWQLDTLRIGDEDARLQGTGSWRLRGPDRGLGLKATVKARNLGAWMAHAGWPDVMTGGQGQLKGQFQWRGLPWTRSKADLGGTLQVELGKGRFQQFGSHSAKLLEFLSLQSISRLTKLDRGLAGLPKDGFPFDQLQGSLSMKGGVVQVHDYKVIGSVGTILLEGSTNIVDETLNLQAVIVPNLDVSGAAIAAGIAVNPMIGLGAFITQWLLRTPLAKAMTVRYKITGPWDDPQVQEIPLESAGQAKKPDS